MAAPAVARPQAADTDIPRLDLRAVAAMSADEVLAALESSPRGLSESEARRRRARYGLNRLVIARRPSVALRFLAQVTHFFALLLWAAAALAFLGGMPELGWAIIVVILINAVFSFWQEYRAERAVEALQRLLPATALVLRDGEERLVPAEELVPGDVLVLRAGDHISADARLLEQHDLTLVAAALTGEALPVRKTVDPVESSGYNITELPNIVYAGTSVASGTGRAVVVATGMATRFGQIVHLTQQVAPEPTPLQRQLAGLTRTVALLATSIGIIFFTVGVTVMKMPLVLGFLFGIGVIVALVPEGLLPTLTLSLALSVQRMARRNAIVKQLAAVDALGATTVICTDKTGTLTQGVMLARELWTLDSSYEATGTGYDPTGTWRPRAGAAGLSETARLALICGALCVHPRGPLPPRPWGGGGCGRGGGPPSGGGAAAPPPQSRLDPRGAAARATPCGRASFRCPAETHVHTASPRQWPAHLCEGRTAGDPGALHAGTHASRCCTALAGAA
jgi:magnesium-transporting ATPase (P-type)